MHMPTVRTLLFHSYLFWILHVQFIINDDVWLTIDLKKRFRKGILASL